MTCSYFLGWIWFNYRTITLGGYVSFIYIHCSLTGKLDWINTCIRNVFSQFWRKSHFHGGLHIENLDISIVEFKSYIYSIQQFKQINTLGVKCMAVMSYIDSVNIWRNRHGYNIDSELIWFWFQWLFCHDRTERFHHSSESTLSPRLLRHTYIDTGGYNFIYSVP